MAGTFSVGETKRRPGVYSRYENGGKITVIGAENGVGAAIFKAPWGPVGEVVTLDQTSDLTALFGTGQTTDILTEMFAGGCTSIKAVRLGTGGTKGKITLSDTADTPVDVVEITANYVGSRAFTVSVRDSILYDDRRECIIYDGTREFEKLQFTKGEGEPEALVQAFASSKNFTARKIADGNGTLKGVAQSPMTAGTEPTATTAEYSAALSAIEASRWNVLCVDTSDTAVHALVAAFLDRIEANGSFPLACIAETGEVELATRMEHAAQFNSEKMHYVLNSAYDASGTLYDGYRLAARIGGMIAAVEANTSLTHRVIDGLVELAEPLTNSQVEKALVSGCICLTLNSDDRIWIEQAINTLITPKENQDEGWKKIRRVKTRFELMDRINRTVEPLIGLVNNDSDGRAAIIAAARDVLNTMIAEKKLSDGDVYEDSANPAIGDSAWFIIEVDDLDSIEKVYLTYYFRFAPEN